MLGSCIGISSAYAAPPHNDPTDLLFTTAFVGKCGPTQRCRCDPRGCEAALFKPRPRMWKSAALYHGGKRAS